MDGTSSYNSSEIRSLQFVIEGILFQWHMVQKRSTVFLCIRYPVTALPCLPECRHPHILQRPLFRYCLAKSISSLPKPFRLLVAYGFLTKIPTSRCCSGSTSIQPLHNPDRYASLKSIPDVRMYSQISKSIQSIIGDIVICFVILEPSVSLSYLLLLADSLRLIP